MEQFQLPLVRCVFWDKIAFAAVSANASDLLRLVLAVAIATSGGTAGVPSAFVPVDTSHKMLGSTVIPTKGCFSLTRI